MSGTDGFRSTREHTGILRTGSLSVSAGGAWLLGISAVVVLAYWPTAAALFQLWADTSKTTYTHGYFVAAIVAWLLARTNPPIRPPATGERIVAGVLMCLVTVLWLVAYKASLELVHEVLLPPIAVLAIWMTLGRRALLASLFPWGYLYFAISVWDFASPLLQSISVLAVQVLLRGLGVTAYFEGNTIQFPSGTFEIAGGCSGLHFFMVAIAIAALYGEMSRDSWRIRLILVTTAAALAVVMNWVRITTIVLVGYYTDMQHPLVKDHSTFGWILFGVFMALFFAGCRRWLPPVAAREARSVSAHRHSGGSLAMLACLLLVPALSLWSKPDTDGMHFEGLAGAAEGWDKRSPPVSRWAPEFPGADRVTHEYFTAGAAQVEGIAAFYAYQNQGKELVGYATSLTGRSAVGTSMPEPASNPRWNEWRLEDASGTWLVWHSYRVGTTWYRAGFREQLAYGWKSMFGATPSMVVLVRSACATDCGPARDNLAAYVRVLEHGMERKEELQ